MSQPVGTSVEPATTPHLIALDIDGTLLTHGGELSAGVRQAVADVRAAGHHVVLASGRSLIAMTPVARALGIDDGPMVCSNGAVTVRLDAELPGGWELDHVETFDPGPALRLLRTELPDALFAVEDIGVGFRMNDLFPEGELDGLHQVVSFEDLWSRDVTRVVVRSPERTPEDFSAMAARIGLGDVTYAVGWTAWMDLAPQGVTKASGLERLRTRLGVQSAATLAVGDGHNDVDMLRWAGRGVAMGDADDVVRAAADDVTGTVAEDGVVSVLRSLLD
jgi:hydroxymethylpyrimidine pyrophosphatase-like HAD family hydrolase